MFSFLCHCIPEVLVTAMSVPVNNSKSAVRMEGIPRIPSLVQLPILVSQGDPSKTFNHLDSADDITLLEVSTYYIATVAEHLDLIISVHKTEYMIINGNPPAITRGIWTASK